MLLKSFTFTFYFLFTILFLDTLYTVLSSYDTPMKAFDEETLIGFYPFKRFSYSSEEFKANIQINSNGFRKFKRQVQESPIFFLGDSFGFGLGVEDDDVFSEKSNGKIQNFSLPYSTIETIDLLIQKLETPKSKVYIVQISDFEPIHNEMHSPFFDDNAIQSPNIYKLLGKNLFESIDKYDILSLIVKPLREDFIFYKEGKEPNLKILSKEEISILYPPYTNKKLTSLKITNPRDRMEKLKTTIESKKASLYFVYIPFISTILQDESYKSGEFYKSVEENCELLKMNCLLFNKSFIGKDLNDLYFHKDPHLNRRGHERLFELIKSVNIF
jgi:hypothetical protein